MSVSRISQKVVDGFFVKLGAGFHLVQTITGYILVVVPQDWNFLSHQLNELMGWETPILGNHTWYIKIAASFK